MYVMPLTPAPSGSAKSETRDGPSVSNRVDSHGSDAVSDHPVISISVAILSDVRFVREALTEIFGRGGYVRVLGGAVEFDDTFDQCLALRPDIVLIDTALPEGLATVRRIRQLAPQVRVVAIALAETEDNVIAWAEGGISGYVPRSAALSEVAVILQNVMRDEQVCSSRVASGLMRRIAEAPHADAAGCSEPLLLTRREREIVQLIDDGLSNKEIARRLHIGVATTKSHVHNVLGKLGVGHRGQAAHWMREQARMLARPVSHNQHGERTKVSAH